MDRSWKYIKLSQTHEFGNWNRGRAIPREGIHKWDFSCSVCAKLPISASRVESPSLPLCYTFPHPSSCPSFPPGHQGPIHKSFPLMHQGRGGFNGLDKQKLTFTLFKYLLFLRCFAALCCTLQTMHINKFCFST